MKILWFLLIGIGVYGVCLTAFSAPDDMSVSGFEKFKQKSEDIVEKKLLTEFKGREDVFQKLSKPLKTGDQIAITLIQGGRQRQVSGRFKGIKRGYAEIDERRILLSDIDKIDRERLSYADEDQLLQLRINQLKKKLGDDKNRKRKLLLDNELKNAGYTKIFFKSTIKLGGRYWYWGDFGDKKIKMRVTFKEGDELVAITIVNNSGTESSAVVLLKKNAVYTTMQAIDEGNNDGDPHWKKLGFALTKDELGDDPVNEIRKKLRLWLVREGVGSWYLKPRAERKSKSDGDSTTFTFRLIKSTIKDYTRAYDRDLSKMQQTAEIYQENVLSFVAERDKMAAEKAEALEKEKQARAEKQKKQAALKREKEAFLKKIEQHYSWFTSETVIRRNVDIISPNDVRTSHEMDDYNFPTLFDNKDVLRFTSWMKAAGKSRILYGRKYRLLKVGKLDTQFFLQYQAAYTNTEAGVAGVTIHAVAEFENDKAEKWTRTFSNIPPSWSGKLFGVNKIPAMILTVPISSVMVDIKEE